MKKTRQKKFVLKDFIILVIGVVIGVAGQYYYTHSKKITLNSVVANTEGMYDARMSGYLKYLESSLDSLHQVKSKPIPGEWLYDHKEEGQTMEEYVNSEPIGKTKERYKVYVQMLGEFNNTEKSILILTADYLKRFYGVHVEIMEAMQGNVMPEDEQREHQGYHQLNSLYILNKVLKPRLPDDALAYMMFTKEDLFPSEKFNFVFGQASLRNRVGVYSLARFGDPNFSKNAYQQCLIRTLKVASHELGHMFSVKHCIQYECVMNGSNSVEESDFKPQYLCPKDLFKVCWNLEIDEVYRFQELASFWDQIGETQHANFYRNAISTLEKK